VESILWPDHLPGYPLSLLATLVRLSLYTELMRCPNHSMIWSSSNVSTVSAANSHETMPLHWLDQMSKEFYDLIISQCIHCLFFELSCDYPFTLTWWDVHNILWSDHLPVYPLSLMPTLVRLSLLDSPDEMSKAFYDLIISQCIHGLCCQHLGRLSLLHWPDEMSKAFYDLIISQCVNCLCCQLSWDYPF
jgi:hypothetical protein